MADRITIILGCTTCKNKNYHFARGKKKEFKIELKKFCRACGKQAPQGSKVLSFSVGASVNGKPAVPKLLLKVQFLPLPPSLSVYYGWRKEFSIREAR